jgi:hypothetical protein
MEHILCRNSGLSNINWDGMLGKLKNQLRKCTKEYSK